MAGKLFECPSCKNPAVLNASWLGITITCNGVYDDKKKVHSISPCGLSINSDENGRSIESLMRQWNRLPRY